MKATVLWGLIDEGLAIGILASGPENTDPGPEVVTLPAHNSEIITSSRGLTQSFREAHRAYLVLSQEESIAGKGLLEVQDRIEKGEAYCQNARRGLGGKYNDDWRKKLDQGEKQLRKLKSDKATLEASVNDLSARIGQASRSMLDAEQTLLDEAGAGKQGFVCGRCYRVVTSAISYRHAIYCERPDSEWPLDTADVLPSGLEEKLIEAGKALGYPELVVDADGKKLTIEAGKAEWKSFARINDWMNPELLQAAIAYLAVRSVRLI